MREAVLIIGMMAVTFGVRYPPLALVGRFNLSDNIIRALRFVPVAVLTAITVPYMLYRDDVFSASLNNPYLVAGVVSIGISYFSKNLLVTIVAGLAVFFGYKVLIGV